MHAPDGFAAGDAYVGVMNKYILTILILSIAGCYRSGQEAVGSESAKYFTIGIISRKQPDYLFYSRQLMNELNQGRIDHWILDNSNGSSEIVVAEKDAIRAVEIIKSSSNWGNASKIYRAYERPFGEREIGPWLSQWQSKIIQTPQIKMGRIQLLPATKDMYDVVRDRSGRIYFVVVDGSKIGTVRLHPLATTIEKYTYGGYKLWTCSSGGAQEVTVGYYYLHDYVIDPYIYIHVLAPDGANEIGNSIVQVVFSKQRLTKFDNNENPIDPFSSN